jgi:hypothetical protein
MTGTADGGLAFLATEMERADWLDSAFDSAQALLLLVTAITHHQFSSPIWGEHEVRKLYAELAEIEHSARLAITALPVGLE